MAAVTVYRDFGAQENKVCQFLLFPLLFAMKWWNCTPWSEFFECWLSSQPFHSAISPSSRDSLVPLHFLLSKLYHLTLFMSFAVLITACGPARYFTGCALYRSYISRMTMYSFLNFQPVCFSMSGSVASWPAYRFLKREIKWPGIPISKKFPQFIVIHTVKGFNVVDKTEVDVFLELPCILHDPMNVGNLISGSSL